MQFRRIYSFIPPAVLAGLLILWPACAPSAGFVDGPAGQVFYDAGPGGPPALSGDAPRLPVVLLHGFAGNTRHWSAGLALLRRDRRAIAVDLRGHGRSDRTGPFSIPDLAADVVAVVNELGLQRIVLVGHSMSGLIALECARRLGDRRVAGVYLLDSGGVALLYPQAMKDEILASVARDRHAGTIAAYWEQMLGDASPGLRERLFADLERLPRPAIRGLMRSMFRYDARPALRDYGGRLGALVTAANDGPTALHRFRDDFPVERLQSENHWWHLDEPEAFHERLADFLESVESEASQP